MIERVVAVTCTSNVCKRHELIDNGWNSAMDVQQNRANARFLRKTRRATTGSSPVIAARWPGRLTPPSTPRDASRSLECSRTSCAAWAIGKLGEGTHRTGLQSVRWAPQAPALQASPHRAVGRAPPTTTTYSLLFQAKACKLSELWPSV